MVAYYSQDIWLDTNLIEPVQFPTDSDVGSPTKLIKYLNNEVGPKFDAERVRLKKLEAWSMGKQPEVRPLKRNTERYVLQRLARTPWVPLMISTFAQQMIVDGYRKDGDQENGAAWDTWEFNNMRAQQISLNRATMTAGYSYLRVTDGIGPDQKKMAVMRGVDPQNAFGLYADPYGDEYPAYLLERRPDGTWRWWDEDTYTDLKHDGSKFKLVNADVAHHYGTVPFVRYINQIDLKGRCWGDVEPIIDLAARIDKTTFDRLLVQHFNSYKVRYATGLEQPDTELDIEQEKLRLSNEDILVSSEAEAKFGTLEETKMDSFISAGKADLETFTAVNQLPPNLLGQIINVAADALDGARRSTYQKLFEKQTMMGTSHAQALRLAAYIEGREDDAKDFSARVHWQDVEVRSLAQFADAWGKIVDQLGVPKWAPWNRIPGVDQSEVEEWKKHALDDDPLSKYLREVVGVGMTKGGATGLVATDGAFSPATGGAPASGTTKNQPKPNNKTGNPKSASA